MPDRAAFHPGSRVAILLSGHTSPFPSSWPHCSSERWGQGWRVRHRGATPKAPLRPPRRRGRSTAEGPPHRHLHRMLVAPIKPWGCRSCRAAAESTSMPSWHTPRAAQPRASRKTSWTTGRGCRRHARPGWMTRTPPPALEIGPLGSMDDRPASPWTTGVRLGDPASIRGVGPGSRTRRRERAGGVVSEAAGPAWPAPRRRRRRLDLIEADSADTSDEYTVESRLMLDVPVSGDA